MFVIFTVFLVQLGLKEEEVTKFQTGGPDGDLGSNEILISKARPHAISLSIPNFKNRDPYACYLPP